MRIYLEYLFSTVEIQFQFQNKIFRGYTQKTHRAGLNFFLSEYFEGCDYCATSDMN